MLDGGWWPRSPLWRAGTSRYSPRAAIGGPAGAGGAYRLTLTLAEPENTMMIHLKGTVHLYIYLYLYLVDTL